MASGYSASLVKKTARLVYFQLILSAVAMILPACREKVVTKPYSPASPPQITRSHDRAMDPRVVLDDAPEESPDPHAPVNLIKLTDSGIVDLCKKLIDGGNLTPEMENATRLEDCLFQLALRNSPALYEVISRLPPGRHSETFVSSTFMRTRFASFADALAKADPIKESDLFRAALEGSFNNYQMSRGEMKLGMNIPQLRDLRGNGLSNENFSKLVISGMANGDFDFNKALAELDLDSKQGNVVMMEVVNKLPSEFVEKVFEVALSRGNELDLASVSTFAVSLGRQDPEAAITWASGLPEKQAYQATRSMFNEWTAAAPQQSSAHIATMDAGPLKDAAIEGLIRNSVANGAIDEAEDWAATIQDENVRKQVDESIGKARGARQMRK